MDQRPAPAASVVVPSRAGAHRLPALLDALAAQDATEPWELVVVLDGPPDGSAELVARYADRLDVRVLRAPEPGGVVAALNAGFAAARGRVLVRCDDDLTPGPGMVRGHLAHHRDRDDVAVSCAVRDLVPDTPYGRAYGAEAARSRREQWYARPADQRWVDWSAHNSLTRATWERLGTGYDPRFVYGQDSELGYRLARLGVTFVVDPALEVEHRGAPRTAANRVPRAYVAGASRAAFTAVHGTSQAVADAAPSTPLQWAWTLAVRAVAATWRDWSDYERIGRVVERAVGRLPRPIARRVVAFAVEAAGRAGRLHGPADLGELRRQREREQRHEVGPDGAAGAGTPHR